MHYLMNPQLFQIICKINILIFLTAPLYADESSSFSLNELSDIHLNIIPRTAAEQKRIDAILATPDSFSEPQTFEENSAGAATVRPTMTRNAFSLPSKNLSFEDELDFRLGNGLFKKLWVSSPSSTLASDGLGPLYNARSCQRCHIKDGRGHPPEGPNDNSVSMLFKIGIPPQIGMIQKDMARIKDYLASVEDPTYGKQLQDHGLAGIPAEGQIDLAYEERKIELSDGETAWLRSPKYEIKSLAYGSLHENIMFSPRVAPQMIGLGLLEAIPVEDIVARADPEDKNGDGISGRANVVWSYEFNQPMLGRFGLKAGHPTIGQQSAAAFSEDVGISSPLFPKPWGDCTKQQETCQNATHGDQDARVFEIDETGMDLVTFYSRNLGVPARRGVGDPQVLRGKGVFYQTGCISCHQPNYVTHRLKDQPEQSFQLIWPYTDMLLHDMGEGLADNKPEGRATGREWRTPPLWGIGRTEQVSNHTYFLHDGRARSLLEAILWHGGEAKTQRQKVVEMPAEDRAALIKFLESL